MAKPKKKYPVMPGMDTTPPGSAPLRGSNGTVATGNYAGSTKKNVRGMQAFLRSKGYNIKVDGTLGVETQSAISDWHSGAKHRNPQKWNSKGVASPGESKAVARQQKASAKPKPKAGKGGGGGGAGAGAKYSGPGGGNVGDAINELYAGQGARPLNDNYADSLAGIQYDSAINDVKAAQDRLPRDAAQQLADIANWYGQVDTQRGKSMERNRAATASAAGADQATVQGILASIGGGASPAAGMVGAAGADAAALQRALGSNEEQYQNDMTPLLAAEAASAKKTQMVRNTNQGHDLLLKLLDLQGSRGQAKANAQFDIRKYNNDVRSQTLDNLLKIKEYNNSLRQQRFQNRLTSQEAAVAAAMSGAQIANLNADTATRGKGAGGFVPWMNLGPTDQAMLVDKALEPFIDSNGHLTQDPNQVWAGSRKYLVGQGYTSARPNAKNIRARRAINRMLSSRINAAYNTPQAQS